MLWTRPSLRSLNSHLCLPLSLCLHPSPGSALPTHSAETKQEYPPPAVSLAPGMVTAEVGDDLLAYYCTGAM